MKHRVAVVGLVATLAGAAVMVIQLSGRQQPKVTADFRNANIAEVQDAHGRVLLRGTFAPVPADDPEELERAATLAPTETGGQASGDAEIEFRADTPAVQEIEFQVSGVPAGGVFTLVLDGTTVMVATADKKGHAKAEVNVAVAAPTQ